MKSVLFNSNQHLRDQNPQYSYCLCCGKPWNLVKSKTVRTGHNDGSFATCTECWYASSLDELKQYHAELYIMQKESILGMNTIMEYSLEHVLFCVEKEFLKL